MNKEGRGKREEGRTGLIFLRDSIKLVDCLRLLCKLGDRTIISAPL